MGIRRGACGWAVHPGEKGTKQQEEIRLESSVCARVMLRQVHREFLRGEGRFGTGFYEVQEISSAS